jgi:hypothetical protein
VAIKILRDLANAYNIYTIASSIGVGERTDFIDMIGFNSAKIQFTIANIGTSVTVGLEISNDGIKADNADISDEWTVKTSNGTKILSFTGDSRYLRFYWVSKSDGSPTISDIKIFGGSS